MGQKLDWNWLIPTFHFLSETRHCFYDILQWLHWHQNPKMFSQITDIFVQNRPGNLGLFQRLVLCLFPVKIIFRKIDKVQLFWEGHKNLCNHPQGFDIYLVNVKTMRKIVQIFVAFSEKLNFITVHNNGYLHIVDHHHDRVFNNRKSHFLTWLAPNDFI